MFFSKSFYKFSFHMCMSGCKQYVHNYSNSQLFPKYNKE